MVKSLESWKEVAAEYGLKEILKPIRQKISELSSKKRKFIQAARIFLERLN